MKPVPSQVVPSPDNLDGGEQLSASNDFEVISMFDNGSCRHMGTGQATTTQKATNTA
jgi:hypothetical protein